MLLLVGLGNPGPKYAGHRHNIGYRIADRVRADHGFPAERKGHQGTFSQGTIARHRAVVLKPTTYMNDSGRSVGAAMRFFKIPVSELIVIHDELDLVPGKLRVKRGGGPGGHNGLRSIDAHVGKEYRRVRIGIGHPGHKDAVSSYVLHDFAKTDQAWIEALVPEISAALPLLIEGDDAGFMTRIAQRAPPPVRDAAPAV